jgi:two-component system LytT family response regulator
MTIQQQGALKQGVLKQGVLKQRVLIVDDEPPARRHLTGILASDPEVVVVGECGNGRDAVGAIAALKPDVVLLDIHMPELNGFDVIAAVGVERMPSVIFVTAYDEYALRAFDVRALDYVLKPVERDRLLSALQRARSHGGDGAEQAAMAAQLRELVREFQGRRPDPGRVAVKVDGKHIFVPTDSIDWVQAVDDYVRVHVGHNSYLVRGTLNSFQEQLPAQFLRVHRSAILNTDKLREAAATSQGDYLLTLQDGRRMHSGRSYRGAVTEFLRSFLLNDR